MGDEKLVRTTFGPPELTEQGGSVSASTSIFIPGGSIRVAQVVTKPWPGWELKEVSFFPAMTTGDVHVTRRQLVGIINELAQEIERLSPGAYDFAKARRAVQDYQRDCVFEVGRPKGKKLTGRIKRVDEVPEAGGEWVVFELQSLREE